MVECDAVTVDVITETVIEQPVPIVAAYVANPDNAPKWYVNIKSIEWRTSPPAQLGSQMDFVAHFLGRRMAYTYEIVEWAPDERLVMRTASGPFEMETSYVWTPHGEHTHMTLRNRGNPTGFSRLVSPFMAAAMRRANMKDLTKLKEILEATAVSI